MLWLALLGSAFAQDGFDAHGFDAVPSDGDALDFLELWRPESQEPGAVGGGLLFEFANAPLTLVSTNADGSLQREAVIDDLFGGLVQLHGGLHKRVGVGLNMPVWFTSRSDAGSEGPALGDTRLSVPVGIILPEDSGGFGLSVVPHFDLPTGNQVRFLGDDGPHGGASIAIGWEAPKWAMTANILGDVGKARNYMNLDSSFRSSVALAGGYRLTKTIAVRVESTLNTDLRKNSQPGTDAPWEVALSARGRHQNGISWTGGGAVALNGGITAATFRLFAGVGYVFGKDVPANIDTVPDDIVPFAVSVTDPTGEPLVGADIHVDTQHMGRTSDDGEWTNAARPSSVTVESPHGNDPLANVHDVAATTVDDAAIAISPDYMPGRLEITAVNDDEPLSDTVIFDGQIDSLVLGEDGDGHTVLPPGTWTALIEAPSMALDWRNITTDLGDDTLNERIIDMTPSTNPDHL
jgi:hypothetical protein